jgi:ABC-type uncharacterized transport system ATPase subunit
MLLLQQVTKRFDRKMAVDEVSLTLDQGEIVGLLGPNGAGKTTLIRMINQIIHPDKGTIRFKGEIMTQEHLKHVGYLPEERGLYKNMTVEAHALFLGALRGMSKKEALKALDFWLEKFECLDWRNMRIETLSKGMAQKGHFSCSVLHDPDLLILDEPFSGFDPLNVELIQAELIAMKKRGKTILISTHNMKSVEEICDRVALIHQSKNCHLSDHGFPRPRGGAKKDIMVGMIQSMKDLCLNWVEMAVLEELDVVVVAQCGYGYWQQIQQVGMRGVAVGENKVLKGNGLNIFRAQPAI